MSYLLWYARTTLVAYVSHRPGLSRTCRRNLSVWLGFVVRKNTALKREAGEWHVMWPRLFRMNVCTILKKMDAKSYGLKLNLEKLPRKYSCIMLACIYHPPGAENWSMREYMINSLDTILRGSPDCGVILTGDFNQFKDTFLHTHYVYKQLVKIATRNFAILGKMW